MAEDAKHWGYDGQEGPTHWSELAPDNSVCGLGAQQSPIDIMGTTRADLPPLTVNWKAAAGNTVVNNGHTLQGNLLAGSTLTRGDQTCEWFICISTHQASIASMAFHELAGEIPGTEVSDDRVNPNNLLPEILTTGLTKDR